MRHQDHPAAERHPLKEHGDSLEARLRELASIGIVSGDVTERVPLQPFEPIRSRGASLSQAIREDRADRF